MRFGLVLDVLDPSDPLPGLVIQAEAAERAGFDLVWLEERRGSEDALPAALVAAAALAPRVSDVRVGACVAVGRDHPVHVAEEAAVADLALGGRLVLGLQPLEGYDDRFPDAVDVVLASLAPVPFRREGDHWPMPANLDGNTFSIEEEIRVTPAPAQLELPVWLSGAPAVVFPTAVERGLGFVAGRGEQTAALADYWAEAGRLLGPAVLRVRRPARRLLGGTTDGDLARFTDAVREDQRRWRMDTVLVELPGGLDAGARSRAVEAVGAQVRPLVQLRDLPAGVVAHWEARRRTGSPT